MPGPHLSLYPVEKPDPRARWRDDAEDLMGHHLDDLERVADQLGLKVGNDTDGGGVANGHVRELAVPTLHVQVAAIVNGDIGGTKINTARQTSIAAASIAGLTAGQGRWDVLTVDNAGTFAWTTGTAAAAGSATVPAFPASKIPLAKVFHRYGSTKVLDVDDGTNSYILDIRPFLFYPGGPTGAAGGDLAGTYPNPTVAQASAAFALTGDISPAQITANQNNYAPTGHATASVFRLTSDASRDITGLAGGADGRLVIVHNVGAFNIVLKDASGSSSAANQFALTADITLTPDSVAILQYDATSSLWRAVFGAAGGGYDTVEDEGTPVTQRTTVDFTGAGVSVADAGGKTVVTISGGGGGGGTSILLDYVASTDLNSGSAITVSTWTNIATSHNFTPANASSIIEISMGGCVDIFLSAGTHSIAGALIIDGTTRYIFSGARGGGAATGDLNLLSGVKPIFISGLSAAAHTVQLQVFSSSGSAVTNLRASSNAPFENYRCQVIEHLP